MRKTLVISVLLMLVVRVYSASAQCAKPQTVFIIKSASVVHDNGNRKCLIAIADKATHVLYYAASDGSECEGLHSGIVVRGIIQRDKDFPDITNIYLEKHYRNNEGCKVFSSFTVYDQP